jgi:hypothetical protein
LGSSQRLDTCTVLWSFVRHRLRIDEGRPHNFQDGDLEDTLCVDRIPVVRRVVRPDLKIRSSSRSRLESSHSGVPPWVSCVKVGQSDRYRCAVGLTVDLCSSRLERERMEGGFARHWATRRRGRSNAPNRQTGRDSQQQYGDGRPLRSLVHGHISTPRPSHWDFSTLESDAQLRLKPICFSVSP